MLGMHTISQISLRACSIDIPRNGSFWIRSKSRNIRRRYQHFFWELDTVPGP
ncbi:hypothetical protein L207DRAFT_516521 [Hyaloscypha variabilis F]|uniref:Uncharacterized protein n=1 Tax=Hyaloscypha variabilis (strain UAMH 11265 / GT02V1 / F) TaxID=1149755 RepID=A0A2J6RAP3_HYAVF|nr:hypothetical protein L207DRAFT_516521 [Hyaloscypha variabilis F]